MKKPVTQVTQNLLKEAYDYLIQVDERMRPLIEKYPCQIFSSEEKDKKINAFESLVSSIISQQVSGAAAKSIKTKFITLFKNSNHLFPDPSQVAICSIEILRTAGLSQRKAEYIKGLSERFVSGTLNSKILHEAPYEQLLEMLISVRGLGKWSIEMFALFALKRMDIFSVDDLGIQRGMATFIGRDINQLRSEKGKWKYMSKKEMLELSSKFSPYRSLFMWFMWKVESTDISILE